MFLIIKSNYLFKKYAKNISWLLFEQFIKVFIGFFVAIIFARYLGVERFGLFSYTMAFIGILNGIAKLGLDSIVLRGLIEKPDEIDKYLGTAFWLKIISAIVIIFSLHLFLYYSNFSAEQNLYLIIASLVFIFQSFEVVEFYFQSQVLGKFTSLCKVSQLILSSILKLIFIYLSLDLIYFILLTVIDVFFLSVLYVFSYRKKNEFNFIKKFDIKLSVKLLKESTPLIFSGLAFALFSNIDAIMIKLILNAESVGIYMAAYKLTVLWYFLPGLVISSVMPAIVSVKNNVRLFQSRIKIMTAGLVWFAIILALLISVFAEFIIKKTYGSEYIASIRLLQILIWINVLIFFNSCWNSVQVVFGKAKMVMYFHCLVVFLNVIFNLFLIKFFGVLGAAYSIVLAIILSLIVFSFFDKSTIELMKGVIFFWRFIK